MKFPKSLDLENLKKSLEQILKDFKNQIIDIIIFGSVARGDWTVNDVDIAVLFKKENSKLLKQIQQKIKEISPLIHFNWLLTESIMESSLFPTLIEEGYSIKKENTLNNQLGYTPAYLFNYDISKLEPSKKVQFSYALHGKNNQTGLIKQFKGETFGRGTVIVPLKNGKEFKMVLERWDAIYRAKRILIK